MFSITGINGDTPKTGLINANLSEKAPHVVAFFSCASQDFAVGPGGLRGVPLGNRLLRWLGSNRLNYLNNKFFNLCEGA